MVVWFVISRNYTIVVVILSNCYYFHYHFLLSCLSLSSLLSLSLFSSESLCWFLALFLSDHDSYRHSSNVILFSPVFLSSYYTFWLYIVNLKMIFKSNFIIIIILGPSSSNPTAARPGTFLRQGNLGTFGGGHDSNDLQPFPEHPFWQGTVVVGEEVWLERDVGMLGVCCLELSHEHLVELCFKLPREICFLK